MGDEDDVQEWLQQSKLSDAGIAHVIDEGITDGEEILFLRDEKYKEKLLSGLDKRDGKRFQKSFDSLMELIIDSDEEEEEEEDEKEEEPEDEIVIKSAPKIKTTQKPKKMKPLSDEEEEEETEEEEEDDDKLQN